MRAGSHEEHRTEDGEWTLDAMVLGARHDGLSVVVAERREQQLQAPVEPCVGQHGPWPPLGPYKFLGICIGLRRSELQEYSVVTAS